MSVVKELLRAEADGTLSFGNYELAEKSKLSDFEHKGDMYKVKTFKEITKLERNGVFVYESVPGTSVNHFIEESQEVGFGVEGNEDAQITLGLKDDTEYEVFVGGESAGKMKTHLGGKLSLSVELVDMGEVFVKVVEA